MVVIEPNEGGESVWSAYLYSIAFQLSFELFMETHVFCDYYQALDDISLDSWWKGINFSDIACFKQVEISL
jgi:hypothetical protein